MTNLSTLITLAATAFALAGDKKPVRLSFNELIVIGCKQNVGLPVGDGQCATLASEALKEVGAKARGKDYPEKGDYVWGRQICLIGVEGKTSAPLSDVKPGDIMQFRDAKFKDGKAAAHHTAIVRDVDDDSLVVKVWHQNWGKKKYVVEDEFKFKEMTEGWVRVYRASAR